MKSDHREAPGNHDYPLRQQQFTVLDGTVLQCSSFMRLFLPRKRPDSRNNTHSPSVNASIHFHVFHSLRLRHLMILLFPEKLDPRDSAPAYPLSLYPVTSPRVTQQDRHTELPMRRQRRVEAALLAALPPNPNNHGRKKDAEEQLATQRLRLVGNRNQMTGKNLLLNVRECVL
ncbi:hypothetical protein E2C01_078463 [Portunus trituberculatus]|uniref:Uncharacterized protein n=1 Tax=Portunus trituberculatus TaxID=210409 RepID=A0A5B7IQA2_PORTR|nr:hypothetical protein [Portunus trituberculatus]